MKHLLILLSTYLITSKVIGKTLISSALIKMFLRLYNVKRVLFLVDRIELETQAQKEFHEVLKNDYRTVIWKANQSNWKSAEIVVSTVQSFVTKTNIKESSDQMILIWLYLMRHIVLLVQRVGKFLSFLLVLN